MDRSNGYEGIAPEFLARRGSGRSTGIGVNRVRKWARTLPPGAAVIDLGCGPGFPITEALVAESLSTMVSWPGDSCSCFRPRTSATLSRGSPGYWCQGAGCCLRLLRNQ